MPTIHYERGYAFRFYSNESNEPAHIHLIGKSGEMKIWLISLQVARVRSISDHEQTKLLGIVEKNQKKFLQEWDNFRQKRK